MACEPRRCDSSTLVSRSGSGSGSASASTGSGRGRGGDPREEGSAPKSKRARTERRDCEPAAALEEGSVAVHGRQLHYRRCGEAAERAVLLLHGTPSSSAMFLRILPELAAKGYAAAALDLPNCGESFFTEAELEIKDMADAAMGAADALNFPFSFAVIGHHTGAAVALQIAADAPARVRRAVLWGVPLPSAEQRAAALEQREQETACLSTQQLEVRGATAALQAPDRLRWGQRAAARVDYETLLRRVDQQVLCLAGDLETLQLPTMKAASLLRRGRYHHVGAAGPRVVDELPEKYLEVVHEFLSAP